jgi:hypothetical protein
MIVFDIPFEPEPSGAWALLMNNELAGEFPTRAKALAFAIASAQRTAVAINIEGADGRWRAFDQAVLPLKNAG